MCGIAGVIHLRAGAPPIELEALGRMATALRHRGPDECGAYRERRAGLAHTRLSIIDLSTGQQPLANEDGTLWISFNGEIFNYVELRAELEALGHAFRTRSDTEVIVHAWEAWGERAFARFNGQWAIALWDEKAGRLVLSRDPLGVRPLYFAEHDGRLWFASEVKALFAGEPALTRAIDPLGLAEVFTFWSTVPPRTVFAGVRELEPGHVRCYVEGRVTDRAFWEPSYPEAGSDDFAGDFEAAAGATREALEEATRLRMLRSDVPVGSYLSGGIDSSLVAALGLRSMGRNFQTFSLRFRDAEYDETEFQRLMVERLGSRHHEVVVSRADIARVFPEVIAHTERPVLRTAPAPLFLLSRLVRDTGIKVVLTGEGADEMFAGYDLFREARLRRFWARQPQSTARPRLLERLYPYLERSPVAQAAMARQFFGQDLASWRSPGFGHGTRWRGAAALRRLLSADLQAAISGFDPVAEQIAKLPSSFPRWTPLAQDQYLEVRTLLSAYLLSSQGDRMLMANSVEGRFPFLDREVVALANSLPDRFKLAGLDEKAVLKKVAADLVPPAILQRKKQPYRAPDALSFVGEDAPGWIAESLSEGSVRSAGLFDAEVTARFHRKCLERRVESQFSNADNMALVGLLSTQLLHRTFVAQKPGGGPAAAFGTRIDRLSGTRS
ncbi:MAG: asparagine synthase (glutamine-hydrolyzing) [Candidatus Eisenbacteria bacterium]|nr:asparagine synthase (glutamine-hydrolyzing) [Candidatus Eisenbacteria bacterium]